ncbi:hypothetical protein [Mycobacteroides chelonae]|uniref:hypothetical protein n=1 Tax=Mycobacteroides chelonae TaxID=1774 RepID=UPI00061981F1|nr:hypothetical protein [Mycobacteroides chelonae]OLT82490.1 hypothetical protein BKG56_10600 [Mycobacteroides chelonae]
MAKKGNRRIPKVGVYQELGPWQVAFFWPDDDDQGGPTTVTIKPTDDATDEELIGGLSSTWLRQIDFRAAREKWLDAKKFFDTPDEMHNLRTEQLQRVLGREGVSDGYLANLADAYVHLVRSGERSVAVKLADMTGRSSDTIKQHLHRARKAGMLTTVPGKAGGQLTQKALDAIREANRA